MRLAGLRTLLAVTIREWWNDNTFRLAAALAFYTIFSFAPILVVALAAAELVFGEVAATEELVRQVQSLVGPEGARVTREILQGVNQLDDPMLATVFGVLTFVLGSTAVFAELQSALNTIWDVQTDPRRSAWSSLVRVRLRSLGVVLAVGFLLLVSLVISTVIAVVQAVAEDRLPEIAWIWQAANPVVTFVLITLLFATIYKYLPDVSIAWSDVAVGAVVTSTMFMAGKHLIGLYLGRVAIGSPYGAAGSFAVLLIWVYYSALICFFGAEFTQVWARRAGHIRPESYARRIGHKSDGVA